MTASRNRSSIGRKDKSYFLQTHQMNPVTHSDSFQRVQNALSLRLKDRAVKLTIELALLLRLKIHGGMAPFPRTPSICWCLTKGRDNFVCTKLLAFYIMTFRVRK